MTSPGWLTLQLADVPPDDAWLSASELRTLAGLAFEKRRADWRLGRFAAKAALAISLGAAPERLEVAAASSGAPEAWLDGRKAPASLSLSHRGGRALVVVGEAGTALGCDLELVEPRSQAFLDDWLTAAERALVDESGAGRELVANLIWTAKEAAAKTRREGLRLDLRDAMTELDGVESAGREWRALQVSWADGHDHIAGWWRAEPGWVMAVAGEPACGRPRPLAVGYGA